MAIRSFRRRLDSEEEVVIQVLADEVTIQMIADRVRIANYQTAPLFQNQGGVLEHQNSTVRKVVLKITSSIIAIISAVIGLFDIPSKVFPFKLVKGCYLAVMVCFCFCLGLSMFSEVIERPPISVSMARKLKLLAITLVLLAVAVKTVALFIELI